MKHILILFLLAFSTGKLLAQKETFDMATFNKLKGWKKQTTDKAVQFSKEDAAKGTYCIITLYRSIPAANDPKANFDAGWEALVKETVTVTVAPEMQPSATENGWEVLSGYAPFESDGTKGVAMFVSSTGFDKMMSLVMLTNTDAYEKEVMTFLESITLKRPVAVKSPEIKQPASKPVSNGQFKFNTTNFDDGWTATEQQDWVEVTKGNMRVLIHYPNKKADEYNSVLLDGLKTAWNILVASRYKSATGMQFKPVGGWESIEYAEASMVENTTGKTVYVVLFKKNYSGGNGKYMEFIAPDKTSFENEFGVYRQESFSWEKMENMATRNRFAIAASDLKGKWTTNFTGIQQYVNANTGADAGMSTHASNQVFQFAADNTYKWEITVASGFVGSIKFQNVKSTGKLTVPNNWQIHFSDMEGKPKTYNAQFSCIKGARILWIDGTGYAKAE